MDPATFPPGCLLVEVFFEDGPLGVTLHRKPDGIVMVYEIIEGSQAVNMDIIDGDELWSVGDNLIGESTIDKHMWQEIVEYIRKSERPLKVVFRRRLQNTNVDQDQLNLSTAHSESRGSMAQESTESYVAPYGSDENDYKQYIATMTQYNSETESQQSSRPHSSSGNDFSVQKIAATAVGESNSEAMLPTESPTVEVEDEYEESDGEDDEMHMKTLAVIASNMVMKEKPSSGGIAGFFGLRAAEKSSGVSTAHEFLVKPGRRLIRSGCLLTDSKATMWNSNTTQQKQFYLFNDMFVVAIPVNTSFQVEQIFELAACKVCNGEVAWIMQDETTEFGASKWTPSNTGISKEMMEASFAISSSSGILRIFAKSVADKNSWLKDLEHTICSTIPFDSRDIGWTHKIVLGTLHSTVISRDECKLRELLLFMESGHASYLSVDDVDVDGYTALHYACMFKAHGMIRALIQSGADATVCDSRSFSAIHWSCLMLDDIALTVLLDGIFSADLTDCIGNTPLFLACIEGRDHNGKPDSVALKNCISVLLNANASPFERSDIGIPVVFYLASAWQTDALSAFLCSGLIDIHDRAGDRNGYLIHACMEAKSLRKQVGLATIIKSEKQAPQKKKQKAKKEPKYTMGIDIDGPQEQLIYANGPTTLALLLKYGARPNARDASGRSPLHILAEKEISWGSYCREAFFILLEAGARLDDSPQCQTLRQKFNFMSDSASKGVVDEALDKRSQLPVVAIDSIELVTAKLEGSEASKVSYPLDGKEKCVMCSISFTLFRRQHHCRLCSCLCCDECSRKRVMISSSQQRVCDSCYNIVAGRLEAQRPQSLPSRHQNSSKGNLEERDSRKELFGNATSPDRSRSSSGLGGLSATQNTLQEAHDKLMERGEKLNRLAEKTNEATRAADDFARIAKQLNDTQKRGWFS